MQLKDKETGKIYSIAAGVILKRYKAKKKDITASFITLKSEEGEEVGVVIGYDKDGNYSEANKYDLILEEGEKL